MADDILCVYCGKKVMLTFLELRSMYQICKQTQVVIKYLSVREDAPKVKLIILCFSNVYSDTCVYTYFTALHLSVKQVK